MRTGFILGLICALMQTGSVYADDGSVPLVWNSVASEKNCPVDTSAVWVVYESGQDCIRYFTAGKLEKAQVVLIYMGGDHPDWGKRDPVDIPANTANAQRAAAERLARKTGLPVIVLERPGTYGSSGNHLKRRQENEFLALNSALDMIRDNYQIDKFVLYGHSGGATAAAALLTLGRKDIHCAVLTSGAFGLLERARMIRARNGWQPRPDRDLTGLKSPYDPLDHVGTIQADANRSIVIIGNAEDRVTPFVLQKEFAEALMARGHRVTMLERPAAPPAFHNLKGSVGLNAAAACAHARSSGG